MSNAFIALQDTKDSVFVNRLGYLCIAGFNIIFCLRGPTNINICNILVIPFWTYYNPKFGFGQQFSDLNSNFWFTSGTPCLYECT